MADEDFEEEEVWSSVKDGSPNAINIRAKDHSFFSSSSSSSSNSKRLPSSRLIPWSNANREEHGKNHRQSASVNIHDWSKTYKPNSSKKDGNGDHNANNEEDEFDDDDDDDGDRVPPHEWIAKKLARSQIASFSVCEGAGRTLKGRDQRKVRNAILTKTGFLE